jgi:dihydrolipoamide dehydrogenase
MAEQFDLVVIGGGPGGYVAAIRAAQLGMTVAMVEKRRDLGGTCLNVGCIPSKALLDSSELFWQAKHKFAAHGISVGEPKLDLEKMMKRKDEVVSTTVGGLNNLFRKHKITRYQGHGSLVDAHTVRVTEPRGETRLTAKNIILATGSEVATLPNIEMDGTHIIGSTEALALSEVPKHLVVIGGGAIGLELGSVYARLGAKVTVIEFLDSLIANMDRELGSALQRVLRSHYGMEFYLNSRVTEATVHNGVVRVSAEDKKGKHLSVEGDILLVAVGRRAYTDKLGLENVGLKTDERGRLQVNAKLQTAVSNIYAIGDVISGPMLAHKAEEEGSAAAEFIAGQLPHLNRDLIPGVVYTWPEVAAVGKSEEQLKAAGTPYKVGKFPYKASGRARAADETDGFAKILAHQETDEVLGVHLIGPRAADLIAEAVVAMEYRAAAEDIARICHAHPTFSEAIKEAALMATENRAIHI